MQWITAVLAFATTMLVFAIVVATLVETIHRIWGFRSQGMRLMLENLYTRMIEPKLTGDKKLTAAEFATLIMENRAVTPTEGARKPGRLGRLLRWLVDASVMTDIPVEVFTQKLADNRIVGAADTFTDEIVKDVAVQYEAFGKEVSTFFERRARLLSVFVAMAVAWLFYVHPYNLAVRYVESPEIAQAMADRAEDTYASYETLRKELGKLESTAGTVDAEGTEELNTAIDDFRNAVEKAQSESETLQDVGVPLGWPAASGLEACESFPFVRDCRAELFGSAWAIPSLIDALWLVLGGLLVGLGAPFWAQAVSSLTATRDVTRKIAEIVSPGQAPVRGAMRLETLAAAAAPEPLALATFKTTRGAASAGE